MTVGLAVVVTALLLGPVPGWLARTPAMLRHPAVALALWQVVGLGSGLAAVTALATSAATIEGPLWMVFGGAALGLAGYLLAVTIAVTVRTLAARRRHRDLLDLVGDPLPDVRDGLVLASPTTLAYCLPGLRPRVVVTSGALAVLSGPALSAVVAHERAHLRQHHDLVILPFVAWHTAWPFLPGARTARASVALLVEVLADDAARAAVGRRPLTHALRSVSLTPADADPYADDQTDPFLRVRLRRADG